MHKRKRLNNETEEANLANPEIPSPEKGESSSSSPKSEPPPLHHFPPNKTIRKSEPTPIQHFSPNKTISKTEVFALQHRNTDKDDYLNIPLPPYPSPLIPSSSTVMHFNTSPIPSPFEECIEEETLLNILNTFEPNDFQLKQNKLNVLNHSYLFCYVVFYCHNGKVQNFAIGTLNDFIFLNFYQWQKRLIFFLNQLNVKIIYTNHPELFDDLNLNISIFNITNVYPVLTLNTPTHCQYCFSDKCPAGQIARYFKMYHNINYIYYCHNDLSKW